MYVVIRLKQVILWVSVSMAFFLFCWTGASFVSSDSAQEDGVFLPVLMYHHVQKDAKAQGKFVITPSELEQDLQYLQNSGYTAVVIQDLVDYVYHGTALPEKPVMITIDDGYLSVKEYIFPLLEKYQMRAVLSVIGKYSDQYTNMPDRNVAYAHLTWDDVRELSESSVFDIENHTYDMHKNAQGRKGSMKKSGESTEEYKKNLQEDLSKVSTLVEQSTGKKPICYTYPFGFFSKESKEVVKEMGFLASLSCNEGGNYITRDPECLYLIKRYNRPHGKSAEEILTQMK